MIKHVLWLGAAVFQYYHIGQWIAVLLTTVQSFLLARFVAQLTPQDENFGCLWQCPTIDSIWCERL